MVEKRFLNVREVAELTGISVSTHCKWRLEEGRGPPHLKLGRRVVYDRDELLAWMRAQRRTSTKGGGAL